MRQDHKDIKYFIPFGEAIRGFANQQYISAAEINRILRNRGIFTLNTDKDYTLPILQTLLLSPKEFDEIREAYRYREDNYKTVSREISWDGKSDLSQTNNIPIEIDDVIKKKLPTCKLQAPIRFSTVDEDPNHVKAEFSIERHDINKSWYEQTNVFSATIEFIKENDGGRVVMKHTAPETKEIAEEIIKAKVMQYKNNNMISKSNSPKKISFSEFENADRFTFFYRFTTKMRQNDFIHCKDIVDISIKPDGACDILPEKIDWMQTINNIKMSGDSLGHTYFMEDRKYHNSLILWSIDASFSYDYKGEKGNFIARFGFSDYLKKKDSSEFEIEILSLTCEKNLDTKNKKHLKTTLLAELDRQKSLVYNNFIEYQNKVKGEL